MLEEAVAGYGSLTDEQRTNNHVFYHDNYRGSGVSRSEFFKRLSGKLIWGFVLPPDRVLRTFSCRDDEHRWWRICCHSYIFEVYITQFSFGGSALTVVPSKEHSKKFYDLYGPYDDEEVKLFATDIEFMRIYHDPSPVIEPGFKRRIDLEDDK